MISVIDVFAGPGGLGEGFSSVRDSSGQQVFKIALSIEKDPVAHQTLRLRSFFRYFPFDRKPTEYYRQIKSGRIDWGLLAKKYPEAAKNAEEEVWQAELGSNAYPPDIVDTKIRKALNDAQTWVLIGGPPCQVYSQVGRSRIRGESAWHFARDERHLLYKEYLRIIEVHRPPVFIMENVKGLLSSKRAGKNIIDQILADLREPLKGKAGTSGNSRLVYNLYPLGQYASAPILSSTSANGNGAEYIIRCEKHGIPQARHRLILLGIRNDLDLKPKKLQLQPREVNMWKAICDLPALRSRLSQKSDSFDAWVCSIQRVLKYRTLSHESYRDVYKLMKQLASELGCAETGAQYLRTRSHPRWNKDWFFDARLGGICNHSTRSHICEDLWRYFYASCFARVRGKSPVLDDFPHFLLPNHGNVGDRHSDLEPYFADRFRVQVKDRPSTTVTSHICKDGHYFIHPDPTQCRSLTVREAARLQTFPDNYYFMGGRTAQYHQVGNAVPPLLARQIATIVAELFD